MNARFHTSCRHHHMNTALLITAHIPANAVVAAGACMGTHCVASGQIELFTDISPNPPLLLVEKELIGALISTIHLLHPVRPLPPGAATLRKHCPASIHPPLGDRRPPGRLCYGPYGLVRASTEQTSFDRQHTSVTLDRTALICKPGQNPLLKVKKKYVRPNHPQP
jgi:hypothetical protein